MLAANSDAVSNWLRQQKAAGGGEITSSWEDGVEASSSENLSTVDGEEAVLEAIAKESESVPTTADEENELINQLDESSQLTSTVSGEANVILDLEKITTPGAPPADPAKCISLLSSLTRSIFQRSNLMVLCFLDGYSVFKADYQQYLTTQHQELFLCLEKLPVEYRIALPDPPSVPPPDEFSTLQHVQKYNEESLKVCPYPE